MGKLADEVRASVALKNRTNYYHHLVASGKAERAAAYAKTYSLVIEPKVETAQPPPAPIPEEVNMDVAPAAPEPIIVEAPIETETDTHIHGWPKIALAKVWRILPNPRLIAVKLIDDGRIVSMWNISGMTWKINSTVRVKIEKSEGDPIYGFVKQRDDEIPLDRGALMEVEPAVAVPSAESLDSVTTPPSPEHASESQPG